MNYSDIIVGTHVLIQTDASTKEHAVVKGVNSETGHVLVRVTDGNIIEMHPKYIIKSFGYE